MERRCSRLSLPLCALLAACGEATVTDGAAGSLEEGQSGLTSTLVLSEQGLRLVGASADRSRVALCGAADEEGYGSVRVVDVTAKKVLMTGPAGAFCGPFDPAPAFGPGGERLAGWSFDKATRSWQLLAWSAAEPNDILVLAQAPTPEQNNEIALLAFTPDAGRLVYVQPGQGADGYALMVFDFAAGKAVQASPDASLIAPRMSPDGARMAFFADGMGARTLISYEFATATATELGRGHDWVLTASADRSRLAFRTGCTDGSTGQTVCDLREWGFDAQAPALLASDVEQVGGYTAAGDRLVYVAGGELRVTAPATGETVVAAASACWGHLSPDGKKLAWLASCSEGAQGTVGTLTLGELSSTAVTKVKVVQAGVALGTLATEPSFAPDGKRLLFDLPSTASGLELYSYDASSSWAYPRSVAGSDLGAFDGQSGSRLASPDGKRLVYEKTTSWYSPLCPWGSCGYRELRARDLSSSWGSDKLMAAASSYSGAYAGLMTSPFAKSPGGKHLVYLLTSYAGVGKLQAVNTSTLATNALGTAEGGSPELSVALGDDFAAVVNGKGLTLITGLK